MRCPQTHIDRNAQSEPMREDPVSAVELVERILGKDVPFRVVTYDGGELGPTDAATTIRLVSPNALHRIITARGQEIGFSRAIIAGEIEVEGDVFGLLGVKDRVATPKIDKEIVRLAAEALGLSSVKDVARLRPLPPPPEEVRLQGRRHSRTRDAAAIASHYDVSNEFYRILLGPAMTYSCAVFESAEQTLETAQFNKHDLICRKLALEPGKRLLDIGCGWGSLAIHAAKHYGATVVGVTISRDQADLSKKRVVEAGLTDQISIRLQDYREEVRCCALRERDVRFQTISD
jgi:cyclopropane-fatty-acyl-phospholipid synthase